MVRLYPQIPHGERTLTFTERRKPSPVPSADRTVIVGPSWFCIPGGDWGDGRIFEPYCGAPPGIRCTRCNAQLADHDRGDEDPRQP